MKIVYRDENTLIVRPGGTLFLILFALIFMGTGALTIYSMCMEHRVICQRMPNRQVQCRLTKTFFGVMLEEEPIALLGARLDVSPGYKSDTYQPILITSAGELELGMGSNINYSQQRKFVENVNTFVRSPRLSSLDVMVGGIRNLWFGMIFFLIGAAFFLTGVQARFTRWTFDRMQGTLAYRSETIFGVKTRAYALRDIAGVEVSRSRGYRSGSKYRVKLWTHSGEGSPMTPWRSGQSDKERAAAAIREFLQLQ